MEPMRVCRRDLHVRETRACTENLMGHTGHLLSSSHDLTEMWLPCPLGQATASPVSPETPASTRAWEAPQPTLAASEAGGGGWTWPVCGGCSGPRVGGVQV